MDQAAAPDGNLVQGTKEARECTERLWSWYLIKEPKKHLKDNKRSMFSLKEHIKLSNELG
jgi:hypothetical protein